MSRPTKAYAIASMEGAPASYCGAAMRKIVPAKPASQSATLPQAEPVPLYMIRCIACGAIMERATTLRCTPCDRIAEACYAGP